MSDGNDRVLARALVSAMHDDVGQPPEEVLARVLGQTEHARPLPRLVALVVEPPIVMPARVVVGMRRSRLLMVAAALLIATSLVATGIAGAWVQRLTMPNEPPTALERLLSIGVVRVAIAPDGASADFETDVARALADRLGLRVSVVPVAARDLAGSSTWDVALPKFPESSLDRDDFEVSRPYYAWPRAVLVPVASRGTSLADVQGQPICAVARDLGERWLMGSLGSPGTSPFSNPPLPSAMILRENDAACIAALEDGTVRAVVTAALSPADLAGRPELRSVASLPAEPRAVAVRRDGADPSTLVAAVEAVLDDLRQDGTLARYSEARFGADLTALP
jgi:ABC-type amino acid transport substrate-binding protein